MEVCHIDRYWWSLYGQRCAIYNSAEVDNELAYMGSIDRWSPYASGL